MIKFWTTVILISLMVFWELVNPFIQFKSGKTKNYLYNGLIGTINFIITSFTVGIIFGYVFTNPINLISSQMSTSIWYFGFSFVILDLYIYCWHRFLMHGSKWGWRFHKFHHSDEQLNSTSAFRFHIVEVLLSQIPRIALVYILSIPIELFVFYEAIFLGLNIIQHSNISFGTRLDKLLSYFIITPNLHKIHHSTKLSESNTNFSTIFSLWDTIFKSRKYRSDFGKDFKFGIESKKQKVSK